MYKASLKINPNLKTDFINESLICIKKFQEKEKKNNFKIQIPSTEAINLRNKLKDNKLLLLKSDKGQTLVIMPESEYEQKNKEAINKLKAEKLKKDPP